MASASLQNGVRVRVFLIIMLSIGVRIAREFSSVSVTKATTLLSINYFLYGLILLCTVAMSKVAFVLALILQLGVVSLDLVSLLLSLISTIRCINAQQKSCLQSLPGSVAAITLLGLICLLDLVQCWSAYKIIQLPAYTSFLGRRLRVLFSWTFPFTVLNNAVLLYRGQWTIWATPHLVADTLIMLMATSLDPMLLAIVILMVLLSDFLAYLTVSVSVVQLSILVQVSLSLFSMLMIVASKIATKEASVAADSDGAGVSTDSLGYSGEEYTKSLRQRKSTKSTSVLAF